MKTIIGLIIAGIIFYFRFGPGKRHLTEKPSNSARQDTSSTEQICKISNEDYQRFILTKGSTTAYLLSMIKEHGELSGGTDFVEHHFKMSNSDAWSIVLIDKAVSFYEYHNLVGWLTGVDYNPEVPEISIGYAKHISDTQKDYFFYLDPNIVSGDTEIGAFRNGKSFSIYLPEAYEVYGNLKITNEVKVKAEDTIDFLSANGLDITSLSNLAYDDYIIKIYE